MTAIPENFFGDNDRIDSLNHHFLGDINGFFIAEIAGLVFNPSGRNIHEFSVRPHLPSKIDYAKAYYHAPDGLIDVEVRREDGDIKVKVNAPETMIQI